DLRCFQAGEPVQARPVRRLERAGKWARRRPAVAALLGVIVLATLGLLGGGFWFTLQLDESREKAEGLAASEKRRATDLKEALGKVQTAERKTRKEVERLAVLTGLAADDAWDTGQTEKANRLLLEVPAAFRGWEWRYRQRRFQGGYCTLYG